MNPTDNATDEREPKPGAGPEPRRLADRELSTLLSGQQSGVLACLGPNGYPHLSTVLYRWSPEERTLRISTTAGRLKARLLRAEPRAALHVTGPTIFSFAVAEGLAEVSGQTTTPGDATGRELLGLTPGFADPADEKAFLEQVVADRRVVIRIRVSRLYGTILDIPDPT